MTVVRIVPNLSASAPMGLAQFYSEVFDNDLVHELGWIASLQTSSNLTVEMHTASENATDPDLPTFRSESTISAERSPAYQLVGSCRPMVR